MSEIQWTKPRFKNRGGKIYVSLTTNCYGRARFSTGLAWGEENLRQVKENLRDYLYRFLRKSEGGECERLGSENKRLYIDEIARHYLELDCGHIKNQTRLKYEAHIKTLRTLIDKDVRLLSQGEYNDIARQVSRPCLLFFNRLIRHVKEEDITLGIRARNFKEKQEACLESSSVQPFSLQEIQAILSVASERIKTSKKPKVAREVRNYIATAFFTGARTGEILALTPKDIDLENRKLSISKAIEQATGQVISPKTNRARVIDLLNNATEALLDQRKLSACENTARLFTLHITKIRREWERILEASGLEYRRLYQTRHSFATLMLTNKEDIGWVSAQLGHESIQTTFTHYFKYIPQEVERGGFIRFDIAGRNDREGEGNV